MEILKNHRSIRNYLPTKVNADVLNRILECGIRASNTGNMQLYSVVVIQDKEKKEKLSPLHFNQPMVKQAPVLLTICMDINRFSKWCEVNGTLPSFSNLLWLLNGTIDASLFAQNISIAAEAEGLGICYLGTTLYNAVEISDLLHLPVGVIPITTLTLGYPERMPELTERLPLNGVVHYGEYSDFSAETISEIYRDKENLESSKLFVSENNKENLAQVYTEIRYKKNDSEFFTAKLFRLFEEHGFLPSSAKE